MAECDGTAVDVQAIGVDGEFGQARQHLRRERFVELDEIDLIQRQAGPLEHLPDGGHGPDSEEFRRDTRRGVGDEACEWLESVRLRVLSGRDDNGSGAVARLRRVSGGHSARGVKRRPELRERLG